jgi:integrase/recombinase XerC
MVISQLEITMDSIRSLHPLARAWLLDGPLSSHVDAFQALLGRGRYAEGSIDKTLRALAHFAHWMTRCRLSADQIDEALVEQFLDSHLPRCDCHATALRTHGDLRAGLAHLLASLREQQVILELPGPSGPIAEELCRYNVHMRDARGLAIGTREGRLAMVGRLLLCKFAGKPIAIGELQPEDVRGFIATELTRVNSVSHASALAAALRAYFRYRATCGDALHACHARSRLRRCSGCWRIVSKPSRHHCACWPWCAWRWTLACGLARSPGWSWPTSTGAQAP